MTLGRGISIFLFSIIWQVQPLWGQCPANAGSDQNLCDPSPGSSFLITLAGNDPGVGNTGLWTIISGPSGGVFGDPTVFNTTFSAPINSEWTLRWTITLADTTTCSDDVNLRLFAGPMDAQAGPDQNICGGTTTLAANTIANGTGTWSIVTGDGNGVIGSANDPASSFSGTPGQTYTLRWTASNGVCADASDDVDIAFFENVTPNAGSDQDVCGSSTFLSAVPSVGSGSWSIISGAGGSITTPSSATSNFSGTRGVTYVLRWTETNGPCSGSDDVTITLFEDPTPANAGPDQDVCSDTTSLAGNTPTGVTTGTWSVVAGDGNGIIADANSPTSSFSGTRGQVYTLRWTMSNGVCPNSTDDVDITLHQDVTPNAGADQSVCGTSTFLAAVPSIGTGSWSILSGAGGTITTPSSATSAFSGNLGVTYTLQWTETNGPCSDSDTVEITLFDNPSVAAAGPDQDVCSDTTILAANAAAGFMETGTWSVVAGAGGSFGDANSPTSSFMGTRGISYTLRWTISNGVCPISSDDVVIDLREDVTPNAGADQNVCGTSTFLGATFSTGTDGSWSILSGAGGTVTTPTSPTSNFTGTLGTTYTLQWTENNGPCSDTDTVEITFFDNPTAAAAGADQDVCSDTATLAANTASGFMETGTWSVVAGAGGSFGDVNSPTSSFTGTRGISYTLRWTISNGVCPISSDDVVIDLREDVTANAGADQNVCGTSTFLGASLSTGTDGSWSILSGAGGTVTTPTSPTSSFTGTVGTTYTLQWTENNGPCSDTDTVEITFFDNPTAAAAGPDQDVCSDTATLAANAASGFMETGTWSVVAGDGFGVFADTNSSTSTFTGTPGTVYTLRWTISNGVCPISSDDVQISFVNAPTTASAGTDITVCTDPGPTTSFIAVLTGNMPAVGETGLWTVVSSNPGGASFNFIDGADNPGTRFEGDGNTTFTLRWTITPDSGPCPASSDDVVVAFLSSPPEATASDQTVCGDTVTLDGSNPNPASAAWTIVSGDGNAYFGGVPGTLTTNNPTDSFTGTRGTSYTLRYTIFSGNLCNDSTIDVNITLDDDPTPANAGPDQTGVNSACGSEAHLAANTATVGTGTWTITGAADGMGVLTDPNNPTTTFSGTPGQTYTLTWTTSNGSCVDSTDTVDIEFAQSDTASAGPDQTGANAVCGTMATLAGNSVTHGIQGTWSVISGAGGSFDNDNLPNATFTGTTGTTYVLRWTIINNDCPDSSDDMTLELRPNVNADAGVDQLACNDEPTNLAASLTTGISGMWTFITTDGSGVIDNATDPNSAFSGTSGFTYTLQWEETDIAGCTGTDTVDISFVAPPTPDAGPDLEGCISQAITLGASSFGANPGMWSVISSPGAALFSFGDDTSPTSTFTTDTAGQYELEWAVSNGDCVRVDTMMVMVDAFSIEIPPGQAQGIDDLQLEANVLCSLNAVDIQWRDLNLGFDFPLNENPITLNPQPSETTLYQVTVTDTVTNDTLIGIVPVLVSLDGDFIDFNNDGCNDIDDFLELLEFWRLPFNGDADGDDFITIMDFLYINTTEICP